MRSATSSDLQAKQLSGETLTEWIKNPQHLGSVYIKPSVNKRSCYDTCYIYFHYFFCCKYVDNL